MFQTEIEFAVPPVHYDTYRDTTSSHSETSSQPSTPSEMTPEPNTATTARVLIPMRPGRSDFQFLGKEVTEFLDDFNRQAENGGFDEKQRLRVLPDFCDPVCRTFLKKMKPYQDGDWVKLQEAMKEHWRDQDKAQKMGTRAFLDTYVAETARAFPGLSEYYTNFIVYSDACEKTKQLHEVERGFFFFRGLSKTDKEMVLLNMPEGPDGDSITTYNLDKIYTYLRRVYRQREGIRQASAGRAEEEAKQLHRQLDEGRKTPATKNLLTAVEEIRKANGKEMG